MTAKGFLELLRKHGTSDTVAAVLSIDRTGDHLETLKRQGVFLATLAAELEKKKYLRRGNIVEFLCIVENVKEAKHEVADKS